jgi:predicted O-methyltransferase YrrM
MDRESISRYISDTFIPPDPILEQIREQIPLKGLPDFSILPEEGRFLQFLASASNARTALEFGALGGYSGIWIARGLMPDGKLVTVEKDPHHAAVAQEHFKLAGLSQKVDLRLGDALQLLPNLEEKAPYDFIFIDAVKTIYPQLFDWAVYHLRIGGIVAAHNALRFGRVLQSPAPDESSRIVQELNRRAAQDERLVSTIYPGGDGFLVAVKSS